MFYPSFSPALAVCLNVIHTSHTHTHTFVGTHTHIPLFALFPPPLHTHTDTHSSPTLTSPSLPPHCSAHYDPKARSMRANPFPNENPEDLAFAGDNFIRHTGTHRHQHRHRHRHRLRQNIYEIWWNTLILFLSYASPVIFSSFLAFFPLCLVSI